MATMSEMVVDAVMPLSPPPSSPRHSLGGRGAAGKARAKRSISVNGGAGSGCEGDGEVGSRDQVLDDCGERAARRRRRDAAELPPPPAPRPIAAGASASPSADVSLSQPSVGAASLVSSALGPSTAATSSKSLGCSEEEASPELQRALRELDNLREQCMQQRRRINSATERIRANKMALVQLLVQSAKAEDADERDQFEADKRLLGWCRQSIPNAQWEGGQEADELARERDRIKEEKQGIDKLRRALAKPKRVASRSAAAMPALPAGGDDASSAPGEDGGGDDVDETWELRELYNYRMSCLIREEANLREQEYRLESKRQLHLKRQQRLEAADRSTFKHYPLMANSRYQLLNMIGRGGFSEVYRAYDLETNQYCAVKVHELGSEMTDQQRQSYIRRAMREYEIQKTLKHPRIVTLCDCFPISTKAFATVLELVEGGTLDEYCKRYGPLPEKEARGIIAQLLCGLKYLNTNGRQIIHYDIKPSNIFFYYGEVKIADFGLSKVGDDSGNSIELTSQGAGTYWYLPPECIYPSQDTPAKISNKVDVWSTGVLFFELLFKRRPFGHGQSQEALVRAAMAGVSFEVEIPTTPKVSNDAKEFLRRLLSVNRELRPDVIEAFNDPYIRGQPRKSATVLQTQTAQSLATVTAPT